MTHAQISDEGLRRALVQWGGALVDGKFEVTALQSRITEIDWSEQGIGEHDPKLFKRIRSLQGIEHCTKLKTLSLQGNSLTSCRGLAALTSLRELYLPDNDLQDISDLKELHSLGQLNLSRNPQLKDLEALRGLQALRELQINDTAVSDLSPLLELPSLKKLELRPDKLQLSEGSAHLVVLASLMARGVTLTGSLRDKIVSLQAKASLDPAASDEVQSLFTALHDEESALLWKKSGKDATDERGRNLLHRAMWTLKKIQSKPSAEQKKLIKEQVALVQALHKAGVDCNKHSDETHAPTPLATATRLGVDVLVIEALLDVGADPNLPLRYPPIIEALSSYKSSFELFLSRGAKLSAAEVLNKIAKEGQLSLLRRALEERTPGPIPPALSYALLRAAVKADDVALVELLLAKGATLGVHNGRSHPIQHMRSEEMAKYLFAQGVDWQQQGALFVELISWYSSYEMSTKEKKERFKALLAYLISLGVDPKESNYFSDTMLHKIAAESWRSGGAFEVELMEFFISNGVDVNALGDRAKTALDHCSARTPTEMKDLFKKKKAAKSGTVIKRLVAEIQKADDAKKLSPKDASWASLLALALAKQKQPLQGTGASATIKKLLKEKKDAVSLSMSFLDPLHPIVLLWLSAGVKARAHGKTLLHWAIELISHHSSAKERKQQKDLILALCSAGADLLAGDGSLQIPLEEYTKNASDEPLDLELIKALYPMGGSPAVGAFSAIAKQKASKNKEEILGFFLEEGVPLFAPPVLRALCAGGELALVKRAIKDGADPGLIEENKESPLHCALAGDHKEVVQFLLELGVSADLGVEEGHPAIHNVRSPETLSLMLKHGANVRARAYPEQDVAHKLASRSSELREPLKMFSLLVAQGLSLKTPDEHGETASAMIEKYSQAGPLKAFAKKNG